MVYGKIIIPGNFFLPKVLDYLLHFFGFINFGYFQEYLNKKKRIVLLLCIIVFVLRRCPFCLFKIVFVEPSKETSSQDHRVFVPGFEGTPRGRHAHHSGLELSVGLLPLTSFTMQSEILAIIAQNLVLPKPLFQTIARPLQYLVDVIAALSNVGPRPHQVLGVICDAILAHTKRIVFDEVCNWCFLDHAVRLTVSINMACEMSDTVFAVNYTWKCSRITMFTVCATPYKNSTWTCSKITCDDMWSHVFTCHHMWFWSMFMWNFCTYLWVATS